MSEHVSEPRPGTAGVRHWLGFAVSGLISFAVDSGLLYLLTRAFSLSPFLARPIAIGCAMTAGFLAHRRLTFAMTGSPTLAEFIRFVAVAWSASVVNYAIFAGILLWRPATEPLLALIAATTLSMVVSYVGFRFGVFRKG